MLDTKDAIELAKIVFAVGTAIWVYFRFARERTHARRVKFSVDCAFYGPQAGKFLAEFTLRIENKGLVVHRFNKLRLRVRGILADEPLQDWVGQPSRVAFPEVVINEPDVLYSKRHSSLFVEPGVEQSIAFVSAVPQAVKFILVRAEFAYSDTRRHITERVFAVGASPP